LVPLEFEDGTPCIDSGESEAFGDDEFTCQADDEPFDEDIPF
jgi:hypothetical protein